MVKEIRKKLSFGSRNCDIAQEYDLSVSYVSLIKTRRVWDY